MKRIAALTPTFSRDFDYFKQLHESVLKFTSDDVIHHILIPDEDVPLFSQLKSDRLAIHSTSETLPQGFLSISGLSRAIRSISVLSHVDVLRSLSRGELFINVKNPWPPIRGWILQQILKFSAVGSMNADAVLMLDSDVVLINKILPSDFIRDDVVRFYRKPQAITSDMPNHIAWHMRARRMLGLPSSTAKADPDYISSFLAWDPVIVRKIQRRLEEVNRSTWASVLAREVRLSEWTVYGTYVDNLGTDKDRSFTESNSLCHSHWDPCALSLHDIDRFVAETGHSDLAVLIQSTSGTSLKVRREIVEAIQGMLDGRRSI